MLKLRFDRIRLVGFCLNSTVDIELFIIIKMYKGATATHPEKYVGLQGIQQGV